MLRGQASVDDIVSKLPYLGLDLEERADEYVRVEYSPNRPDLSTDYGVARALNGLLGFALGAPTYPVSASGIRLDVSPSVKNVRPFVVGAIVRSLRLDDETIRQIIMMQEDLHNGIGRGRKKVAIGLHNLDVLRPPIHYAAVDPARKFVPLGESEQYTMREIVRRLDVGRKYGYIVSKFDAYPLLTDSANEVLSFPPVINGELTRVSAETRNLFLDITGTSLEAIRNALAVVCTTLADAGGQLGSVEVAYPDQRMLTPDLEGQKQAVSVTLANRLLGLSLRVEEVRQYLAKSRISTTQEDGQLIASIPAYRFDIMHAVDLVEELAIGYGLDRFQFRLPRGGFVGALDSQLVKLGYARDILCGLGFLEVLNSSLVARRVLYEGLNRKEKKALAVERPKSAEHEVLRDLLLPSLLQVLSRNVHEEFPQRIFEVGKAFVGDGRIDVQIREEYHVAGAVAASKVSYSEVKGAVVACLRQALELDCKTPAAKFNWLADGRGARVLVTNKDLGFVGEVAPRVLRNFGLRTPIGCFEVNLSPLLEQ